MREIEDKIQEAMDKLREVSEIRFSPKLQREISRVMIDLEELQDNVQRILNQEEL
jgi:hypothetical protein